MLAGNAFQSFAFSAWSTACFAAAGEALSELFEGPAAKKRKLNLEEEALAMANEELDDIVNTSSEGTDAEAAESEDSLSDGESDSD